MKGLKPLTIVALAASVSLLAACNQGAQQGGEQVVEEIPPGTTIGPIYIPPEAQDISGAWWTQEYTASIVPRLVDHDELPFTEAGQARYEEIMAGLADGSIIDNARRTCVPDGIPRILGNPYPFQIIQTPGQVTIIYELNHVIRPIPLDVPVPSDDELEIFPYYSGHSVAHWEGDTLVVESAGFKDGSTFIDATGVPHTWQMRTVERIRKLDDNTLENVITVTDADFYSEPWSARFVFDFHPDVRLEDYNCGDEHRDISHIPGVNPPN